MVIYSFTPLSDASCHRSSYGQLPQGMVSFEKLTVTKLVPKTPNYLVNPMHSSSILIPIIGEISPLQINTHYSTNFVLGFRNATQYLACYQYYVPCSEHKPIKHDKTHNQKAEGRKVSR